MYGQSTNHLNSKREVTSYAAEIESNRENKSYRSKTHFSNKWWIYCDTFELKRMCHWRMAQAF